MQCESNHDNNVPAVRRIRFSLVARAALILVLAAVIVLAVTQAMKQWELGQGPGPSLPEAKPPLAIAGANSQPYMTAALQFREMPYSVETIVIESSDYPRFERHFYNISQQKGWFPHKHNGKLQVVLPLDEMEDLQAMVDDPAGWVMRHHQAPVKPVPSRAAPTSPDTPAQPLVNVSIERMLVSHYGHTLISLALVALAVACGLWIIFEITKPIGHPPADTQTKEARAG